MDAVVVVMIKLLPHAHGASLGGVRERRVECEGGEGFSEEVVRRSNSPPFHPGNLYPTLLLLPFPCGVARVFECVLTWEAPGGVLPVCFG